MLSSVLAAATESAERELPFPPEVFGLIALAVFAGLLGFTYMFRSSGTKH